MGNDGGGGSAIFGKEVGGGGVGERKLATLLSQIELMILVYYLKFIIAMVITEELDPSSAVGSPPPAAFVALLMLPHCIGVDDNNIIFPIVIVFPLSLYIWYHPPLSPFLHQGQIVTLLKWLLLLLFPPVCHSRYRPGGLTPLSPSYFSSNPVDIILHLLGRGFEVVRQR